MVDGKQFILTIDSLIMIGLILDCLSFLRATQPINLCRHTPLSQKEENYGNLHSLQTAFTGNVLGCLTHINLEAATLENCW